MRQETDRSDGPQNEPIQYGYNPYSREHLERYEAYWGIMEETGQSQMSLTDADARLMKSKNGFAVAYNLQTAVDSETHLIRNFQMTNQVTDHGLLDSSNCFQKER